MPDAFRTGEVNDAGRAIIYVWADGKKDAYELLDPDWSADVFEALNAMNKQQSDVVVNAIGAVTTVVARTVTRDPAFLFANFIRDALSSWVLTDLVVPFEGVRGIADELTGNDNSRLYNMGGGIAGGESSSNVNAVMRQRDGAEIAKRFGWTLPTASARWAWTWPRRKSTSASARLAARSAATSPARRTSPTPTAPQDGGRTLRLLAGSSPRPLWGHRTRGTFSTVQEQTRRS